MRPLALPEPQPVRLAMERHQRVWRLWNWLPAFRAAAEFESLQRAALAVSLSPSALSRSVSLLEEALGVPLFMRSPRGLRLTADGRELLVASRDAVRLIDEGLPTPSGARRRLRACAEGPVLPLVLAEAVGTALPDWTCSLEAPGGRDLIESLRCGDLDFVLTHQPSIDLGTEVRQLPSLQLVTAGPERRGGRVVSLDGPGFHHRGATHTASTWPGAERLARRLELPLVGPACLLRGRRQLRPLGRSVPAFAAWRREVVPDQARPLAALADAAGAFISD
jgi:DNA-binding transcriptional LysR family regulator